MADRLRCGSRILSYRLGELAERIGARLLGDPDIVIDRVAVLDGAGPGCIAFLSNRRYRPYLATTKAGAVILAPEFAGACPVPALVLDNPYLGYARAATLLSPNRRDGAVHCIQRCRRCKRDGCAGRLGRCPLRHRSWCERRGRDFSWRRYVCRPGLVDWSARANRGAGRALSRRARRGTGNHSSRSGRRRGRIRHRQ